jgi:hypothetical protein
MNNTPKLIYTSMKFKLYNISSFSQCGKGNGMNIGPVNEYEAQSAIIPFACRIIRK